MVASKMKTKLSLHSPLQTREHENHFLNFSPPKKKARDLFSFSFSKLNTKCFSISVYVLLRFGQVEEKREEKKNFIIPKIVRVTYKVKYFCDRRNHKSGYFEDLFINQKAKSSPNLNKPSIRELIKLENIDF